MAAPPGLHPALASYLPRLQLARLAIRGGLPIGPAEERLPAAVLFVDLSGFARLTEQLSTRGARGAEELSSVIDSTFGRMTEIITARGGDILHFIGDAVLAAWPAEAGRTLADSTALAAESALAIRDALHGQGTKIGATIRLRASVGAGGLRLLELGSDQRGRQLLLLGDAVRQATGINQSAGPGQVIVSAQAWALLTPRGHGEPLDAGVVRLDDLQSLAMPSPNPPLSRDADIGQRLPAYLPDLLVRKLAAGQGDWLAEFRALSLLFIGLGGLDPDASDLLPRLHPAYETMQEILLRLDGRIYQFLMDDKGLTLVAAFGLPLAAHENDAARATRAALEIATALGPLGIESTMGLTTGTLFTGVYGTPERRQYALAGPAMVRAARLMQAAGGGIRCDRLTSERAGGDPLLHFEPLPPLALKGLSQAVEAFVPTMRRAAADSAPGAPAAAVVGRAAERAVLLDALDALAARRQGGTVLIEGEPGIGKSALIEELNAAARDRGVRVLTGAGDEVGRGMGVSAWSQVFRQLFGLPDDRAAPESQRSAVMQYLVRAPELVPRAPLLDAVLPIGWAPTPEITALRDDVRAEQTRDLLIRLLELAAADEPLLVIIEDAHWLDSASRALARAAAERLPALLLLVTTRPEEPGSGALASTLRPGAGRHLRLGGLSEAETESLICHRLGVTTAPAPVVRLIQEKAAGNPFFSEQLAYTLRDYGVIVLEGGRCRLARDDRTPEQSLDTALAGRGLPGTVQGVVMTRLDRLSPAQQFVVKVGSVIGRSFALSTLRDVHPLGGDGGRLMEDIEELVRLNLLARDADTREPTYGFRHAITQDVAYNSLLFAQRRDLHRAVGAWYERAHAGELSPFYPSLAHHWARAEDGPKAFHYLGEAGAQAVRGNANREAVGFLSEALALEESLPAAGVEPERRQRLELLLGRAYLGLSDYAGGRPHLEAGVAQLRVPVPTGKLPLAWGALSEVARQMLHRFWPGGVVGRRSRERERLLAAARAFEGLAETYYFTGEDLRTFYACVRTLNLAESAGTSAELARGYATLGTILAYVPLPTLSRRYGTRALATAEQVGDPDAVPWVCVIVGIARAGEGDWPRATQLFVRAREAALSLGDRRRWSDAAGNLATMADLRGDYPNAIERAMEVYAPAVKEGDLRYQVGALRSIGRVRLLLGQLTEAEAAVAELRALLKQGLPAEAEVTARDTHGLAALLALRRGEWESALTEAIEAVRLFARGNPTDDLYSGFLAASSVAEVGFALWDRNEPAAPALVRGALAALKGHARVFPIARSRRWLYTGGMWWREGRKAKAHRAWTRSVAEAARHEMPLDQALAQSEIGRHLLAGDPIRANLLENATQILSRIGARGYLPADLSMAPLPRQEPR